MARRTTSTPEARPRRAARPSKRRALQHEDKQARRRVILAATLALFEKTPFGAVKMASVAQRARLAKGTVFFYFPTKEALFLALLGDQLTRWLELFAAALEAQPTGWTRASVATILAQTFGANPTLTRLLTLLTPLLEGDVPIEQIAAFQTGLAAGLTRTGALLEQRLAGLAPGDGVRLLLRTYAIVIGLRQVNAPPRAALRAIERSGARVLLIADFEQELALLLRTIFDGPTG